LLLVFVQEPSCFVSLLEAARVVLVSELEGPLELKRAEVVLLDTERSGETASAIELGCCEKRCGGFVIDDASGARVDAVSPDRDGLAFQIIIDLLGHIVIISEFNDQVAFVITLELADDVDFIEVT
jgi:hypothetical protein